MSLTLIRSKIVGLILILAAAGCGSYELVRVDPPAPSGAPPVEAASGLTVTSEPDDLTDPQLRAAREQAQQMIAALGQGAAPAATQAGPPVRWIDARHPDARDAPTVSVAPFRANTAVELDIAPPPAPSPQTALVSEPIDAPAPSQTPPADTAIDHHRLARVMMHQLRHSDDPALKKAIDAVALSVVSGDRTLSPDILASLDPRQRETVSRFHLLMIQLTDRIAERGHIDPETISEQLDATFGVQPIEIETVQLCRRVDNYGVYEPFAGDTFLAGRDQRMIVYVQLDHFASQQQPDDLYEVRLSQEIVLYNASDGLPVWRLPIETIVDRSRNRRRDFFTVKIIRLPARLGVGKYQLKVTVNDLHGSTTASATIPINLVADQTLVSGAQK
jgi:hypothetical protein